MIRFVTIFLVMVAATSSQAGNVEYVVMDLRSNPDLRDQWNTDSQQVLFAHVDGVEYQIIPNDPDWNTAYVEIEVFRPSKNAVGS